MDSTSLCVILRLDVGRLHMMGDVLAKTCDTGPGGDKAHQCRVIGTGRITIDHGLAFDNLQQSGVM